MYLNLRPTLWPKTNSCAKLIYVLNICNKMSTKFAFVLVYSVAKELSAGTENGRPDAYHGAAFVYGDVEIVAHAHRQFGEIG